MAASRPEGESWRPYPQPASRWPISWPRWSSSTRIRRRRLRDFRARRRGARSASSGDVLAQLTDARDRLNQCVETNSAALIGNVIVMDASGAGDAAGAQTAMLWELADSGPTAREVTQVQAGTFGFKGPIPASAAITLHSANAPDLAGPDYRSGRLQGDLGDQPLRLEMVFGPRLTLSAGVLKQLASQFPPTTQALTGPATLAGVGPATVTVNGLTVVLADGSLTLTATGTLAAAALPATPFSGSVSIVALPSDAPDAGDLVQVILAGANPVQVSLPGLPGLSAILSLLSPFVGDIAKATLGSGFITRSLERSPRAWRSPSFRRPPPCHFAVSRSTSRASPSNRRSASSAPRCRASVLRRSHPHSPAAPPGERRLPAATRAGEAVMAALVPIAADRADALSALAHPANGATSKSHARSTRAKRKCVGPWRRPQSIQPPRARRVRAHRGAAAPAPQPARPRRRRAPPRKAAAKRCLLLSRHLGRPGLISRTRGAPPFVHASERRRVQASNARPGGLRDGRVGRHEIGQAVACAGVVEPLDGGVKARPQLLRTASPGPRAQLVRRPRALRPFDRTPGKPGLQCPRMRRAHRVGRLRQRPQTIPKAGVGRRELVRAHRARPRGLGLTDSTPGVVLRAGGAGLTSRLGNLAHPPFLPHRAAAPHFNPQNLAPQPAPSARICGSQRTTDGHIRPYLM